MDVRVFSDTIGAASSLKMCRSVLIKGAEALLVEALAAAHHYGVVNEVLSSLSDTLPETDWNKLAPYMIGRTLQHGKRRAEEMQEAARTVAQSGLDPWLCGAIAKRQARAGASGGAQDATQPLAALLELLLRGRRPT